MIVHYVATWPEMHFKDAFVKQGHLGKEVQKATFICIICADRDIYLIKVGMFKAIYFANPKARLLGSNQARTYDDSRFYGCPDILAFLY
jgi:hypothetical protein